MRSGFLTLILALFLCGCAVPKPDVTGQRFVPERDVVALALTREGINFLKGGRFVDAEMRFRKALILLPESAPIQQNLGIALYQQERFEEALTVFRALPRLEITRVSELWIARAIVEQGDLAGGLRKLDELREEAILSNDFPGAALIARTGAAILFGRGETESALSYSGLALTLDPLNPDNVRRHVRLLLALGLYDSAWRTMRASATDVFTLSPEPFVLTAVSAAIAAGDLDRAKSLLLERMLSLSVDPLIGHPARFFEFVVGLRSELPEETVAFYEGAPLERLYLPLVSLRVLEERGVGESARPTFFGIEWFF